MVDRIVDLETVVELDDIIEALRDLGPRSSWGWVCRPTTRGTRSTIRS